MEALTPLGVPNVSNSMPDLPIRPEGRSEELMFREVVLMKCLEVWESRLRGDLNMECGVAGIISEMERATARLLFICKFT